MQVPAHINVRICTYYKYVIICNYKLYILQLFVYYFHLLKSIQYTHPTFSGKPSRHLPGAGSVQTPAWVCQTVSVHYFSESLGELFLRILQRDN